MDKIQHKIIFTSDSQILYAIKDDMESTSLHKMLIGL